MFFISEALAQTAQAAARPNLLEQMFFPALVLVFFYFVLIRPQSKKAKAHREFLGALKKGDSVITTSGIFGRIEGLTDRFVTLDVGDGVRLKVIKSYIAGSSEEKTT